MIYNVHLIEYSLNSLSTKLSMYLYRSSKDVKGAGFCSLNRRFQFITIKCTRKLNYILAITNDLAKVARLYNKTKYCILVFDIVPLI